MLMSSLSPRRTPRIPAIIALLIAFIPATFIVCVSCGAIAIPAGDIIASLTPQGVPSDPTNSDLIWEFRLPRVLTAMVVGALVSVAGVALQTCVRNPLADPFIVGVSPGATVGAVLVMTGMLGFTGHMATVLGAAVTGAVALLVVLVCAYQRGTMSGQNVALVGVAVGQLAMAITTVIELHARPAQLRGIMFWLYGSVAGSSLSHTAVYAGIGAVIFVGLWLFSRVLDALYVGDDSALAVGISPTRWRIIVLIVTAFIVAISVFLAGGVGFVGLIVPHISRLLVGASHRRLLVVAALLGAIVVALVDLVSRVVDIPHEYPISVFTALVGAPIFVFIVRRNRIQE